MNIFIQSLSIIFYILLIVLVIALIVLVINSIKTLSKVDRLVDDVTDKSRKLDGLFNIVDMATDAMVGISDTIVGFVTDGISRLFKRKKGNEHD